jgi:hypothetical protein
VNRFSLAMALFAILGAACWATLTDARLRAGTLVILGMFAFRTWIDHRRRLEQQREQEPESWTDGRSLVEAEGQDSPM